MMLYISINNVSRERNQNLDEASVYKTCEQTGLVCLL